MAQKTHRITILYLVAVGFIYGVTSCAWLVLGSITESRTNDKDSKLRAEVGRLWGGVHTQVPPRVVLLQQTQPPPKKVVVKAVAGKGEGKGKGKVGRGKVKGKVGKGKAAVVAKVEPKAKPVIPARCLAQVTLEPDGTDAKAKLSLEHRRKGLLWYSTYGVRFNASYTLRNPTPCKRPATIWMPFPASGAVYDAFTILLDGEEVTLSLQRDPAVDKNQGQPGAVARVMLKPGAEHTIGVRYHSRGLDRWNYALGQDTARAKNFKLVVSTNFDQVDFPSSTLAPSAKRSTDDGWQLSWQFSNLLADSGIAVLMPQRLNPGPLATEISRFAPVSLFFFFFVLLLVSVVRQVRLHPVHFGMLAAAFFSFHLLMAYLVDHVPLSVAFMLSSVTSVGLVVSYLRLAIGTRFAVLWAGGAQLLYLVLFSLAFFLEGYTGLTITIFSILTLFMVMQLTARIDWAEKFGRAKPAYHGAYPTGHAVPVHHAHQAYGPAHVAYAPAPQAPAAAPAPQPAPPMASAPATADDEDLSEPVYSKVE